MNEIDIQNLAAGFPSNQSFIGFMENQLEDIHAMWSDELFSGVNHIIKGVSITKGTNNITLGEGLILFNFEIFKFPGATVQTVDFSQIDLFVVEDTYTEVFGDESTYPTYHYRSLDARVQNDGNFRSFKRSYIIPIREYAKAVSLNSIVSTLNHSILEHHKNGTRVNASIRTSSYGDTNFYFVPVNSTSQAIFDIYTVDSFKAFTRRLSGNFSALWYDANNVLVGGISGVIVQENIQWKFYSNSGVRLTISQLTGVIATNSPVSYADVMFGLDIITDFI